MTDLPARTAFLLAAAAAVLSCSSEPPSEGPSDAGLAVCDRACDDKKEICNAVGQCEVKQEYRVANAIERLRGGAFGELLESALVTYVPPEFPGANTTGFFVQATREGPALFVGIDPLTLRPPPKAGDRVRFRVTAMQAGGNASIEARGVSDWAVLSSGNDLSPIIQDISHEIDVVDNGIGYDGEIVSFQGLIRHEWFPLGASHLYSQIELLGGFSITKFILRVPKSVATPFGPGTNCEMTVGAAPLRRVGDMSQIWAFRDSDFVTRKCPDTRIEQALALTPTDVRLRFERPIDPQTVRSDGSQFTFTGGLTAMHAAVQEDGREVMLITSTQSQRSLHELSIADEVRDVLGGKLALPDHRKRFLGWFPRARLVLNEVNCNVPDDRDLVELRAVTAGSTDNLYLTYEGPKSGTIGVFPDSPVKAGDIIVVHLNTNINKGDSIFSETGAKDEYGANTNFPNAWDFVYEDFSCEYTNVILRVRNIDGSTMDGLAAIRGNLPAGSRPVDYPEWLNTLQEELHWKPASCNGLDCSYFSVPSAIDISANWAGMSGSGTAAVSLSRRSTEDTDTRDDWAITTRATLGSPNSGQ